ncbi:MAG: ribonucleoside-diphosphate reductase subunit alpha [Sulfurimonas sp.]|nr:ribonucleoside-diphosphate reductase subunit alpha [Sulfurimonas sp.]
MVKIDLNKSKEMTPFSRNLVKSYYTKPKETIQHAYARAATCYSNNDEELAQRLYNYVSDGWFMFASPLLSNAVNPGEQVKGLPISCFLTYVPDTIKGLCKHTTELRWLSVKGGGVGGHWSDVRSMNTKTPGPISFLHTVDADMLAYRQGATRRGSYASYLDISHPDIIEFIKMRLPTGDITRKNLNLHHGVNVSDSFLNAVEADLDWKLIDPKSKKVIDTVKARSLWETLLETRYRTGEPYINYLEEANRRLPKTFRKAGLFLNGSNLCNEIHLVTGKDRTAVCCLSSVNLAKYDEWKDTHMVQDLITMLDNTLQFFIDNAPHELRKAVFSAKQERSLGLGAMGFHDYLQSKNIPWESSLAISTNRQIFANIQAEAILATKVLYKDRGKCYFSESDRRNTHLLAIAPTANSSVILGCSASIEPRLSNCYTHKTRAGSYLVKSPSLEKLIKTKGLNSDKVWGDILANEGSIRNLDYFTKEEKEVFKTAYEIDQRWVVDMARSRQEYICQGQSVNLFFPSGTDRKYLNSIHLRAFSWNSTFRPLKGLYYLRTESGRKTEKVALSVQRDALKDGVNEVCLSCEG